METGKYGNTGIHEVNKLTELVQESEQILADSELLYSRDEVETAIDNLALAITRKLQYRNPVVLCPMLGAVVTVGQLLPRLDFPLQLEYIHATRYGSKTSGGSLRWIIKPGTAITDRTVLIVDDILDEGLTLESIIEVCTEIGAREIFTAVLIDKKVGKPRRFRHPDFTGLTVPDRYVFGYGMDYKGYLRNCAGIYAVNK